MMFSFHHSGVLVTYSVASVLSFMMAWFAWVRRDARSSPPLLALFVTTGLWCMLNALEFSLVPVPLKTFMARLSYVPAFFVPVFLFRFVAVFTRHTRTTSRDVPWVLYVVPIFTVVLTLMGTHDWVIADVQIVSEEHLLSYAHGWWFWVAVGYSYALSALAALRLIHAAVSLRWVHRRRVLAVLVPAMVVWIVSTIYMFGTGDYPLVDLNPVAFLAVGILFFHAIARYRFQDIRPVAKERVLEAMPDGLLVFDREHLLVDLNQAAVHFLHASGLQPPEATKTSLLGHTPGRLVGEYAANVDAEVPHRELEIPFPDGSRRIFDVMLSHLAHEDGEKAGVAVLFRDITRYRELEIGQRRLDALQTRLLDAAHDLSRVHDRDSVGDAVARLGAGVVSAESVLVFRLLGPRAIVTAIHGPAPLEVGNEVLVGPGFFSEAPIAEVIAPDRESIRVATGAPDHPGGVIVFVGERSTGFTPEQRDAASLFAVYATVALENARMFSELSRHATVDSLTKVYNRRQFLVLAENAIVTASRTGRDLSLLMIDIDRFKEINDNFGHAAGDEILMAVSNLLQENLRSSEIVGRYGGDEFLVLLEGTDAHKAFRTAERLREQTEESPVLVGGNVVRVTLSIGVSALGPGTRTMESLLEQADRGLYLSKNTGRNQTCLAHA